MKISYEWLKCYLDLSGKTPVEVSEAITRLGHEVEAVETFGVQANDKLVVGEILSRDKHPNADKLSVCKVSVGAAEPLTIVCGAPNCDAGNRVPVALVGCRLPDGKGGVFEIKQAKLRGVESCGMMCGPDEIGVSNEPTTGLLIFPPQSPIGARVDSLFPSDTVLEVKAAPNRGDALSHWGIARDLAAKWDRSPKLPEVPPIAPKATPLFKGVTIEDPSDCPHYRAYVIRGVKVAPSPEWLQTLLKAAGLRPISNLVDITNFICLGLGQPLHAFDLKKIGGAQLKVRRAKEGETLTTLDDKKRALDPSMLLIADEKSPLVVAGIMGGVSSGVSPDTTDIVLEAAQFSPTLIRKTGRKLQLASDSSYRFERGIDPLSLQVAAEQAVALILATAGGQLEGVSVAGLAPFTPRKISVSRAFIAERLGFPLDCEEIEKALGGFGFDLSPTGAAAWEVGVPSWRGDIQRPIDLVEEVLRFYGVDRIPAAPLILPASEAIDDRLYTVTRELSERLIALGYNECMHYTLRTRAEAELLEASREAGALHSLENPLSAEMSSLRYSLLPGLVEALEFNRSRGNALAPLFELGHVYRVCDGKVFEFQSLAFVKAVAPAPENWRKEEPDDFFAAKAVVESLLATADVAPKSWRRLDQSPLWQAFHAAGAEASEGQTVQAGLVSLELARRLGFDGKVLAGEILFPLNAFEKPAAPKRFAAFSAFPGTRRDVALVVKKETPAGEVEAALRKLAREAIAGKFSLESVALFDLYEGKGIPEDHKSLAFALNFRATDRTLTDEEIGGAFTTLLTKLKAAGFQLRG